MFTLKGGLITMNQEENDILKISIYEKRKDNVLTEIIKTLPSSETTWVEILNEFFDMLRALGYYIPLTYEDVEDLPNQYRKEDD